MSLRKLWPAVSLLVLANFCAASNLRQASRVSRFTPLDAREQVLRSAPVHISEFAAVPHFSARARCERTYAPEALTTPNPIVGPIDPAVKVRVSFIIGADGHVHSPLILESAGNSEDQTILETVRSWRYRPAMCNGVPTETEGKIEFSSRSSAP